MRTARRGWAREPELDLGLKGKTAWVLGGSSGLGRAAAASLAREGALVAVSARTKDALEAVADEIESGSGSRCVAVPLDVADATAIPGAMETVATEIGSVDILIANAGGPPPGAFEDIDDGTMRAAFELTAASAWHLAKAVVPAMKERGSGCIIFLTSSSTKEVVPNLLLSNMMRAAVVGMAKTMSKELGPFGIRALCVAPGRLLTPRIEQLDANAASKTGRTIQEVRSQNSAAIALERYGRPEEFGDVVAFLASERASYVTGTSVSVDGGALDGLLS
jgi:3-oxoacyl-[acyl-carrier protein] reductase